MPVSIRKPMTPEQKAHKAEYDRQRRIEKREVIAEQKRAYYLANKEKENARVKSWVEENRERSREIKQAWKERNPDADKQWYLANREYATEYRRTYAKQNSEQYRQRNRLRRKGVSYATPIWADKEAIKAIYAEARTTGQHVDHIIPLKNPLVSGLHVPANLRLMDPVENRRKTNKFFDGVATCL